MKKTMLALPEGHTWISSLATEARLSGRVHALARIKANAGAPDKAEPQTQPPDAPSATELAVWDPLSYASARALLLETENALGPLSELVLYADPPTTGTGFADISPRDIEREALSWAAGWAELLREAARLFRERGSGRAILVLRPRSDRGPLGSMAYGALRGLAEGLCAAEAAQSSSPWRFLAVEDESDQPDLSARHVIKLLDEDPRDIAKIQRFNGRGGLFAPR